MKIRFAVRALTAFALALPLAVHAADPVAPSGWHAQTLPEALAYMVLFAFVGILAAIAGYKLFDKCTPGNLHREILENRNVAAAVVAGASIKGPIGPLSIMFIVYGIVVQGPAGASISKLLLSGVMAELLLLIFQAATVYVVVRRMDFLVPRKFAGIRTVGRTGLAALPVLLI
ncbi:MAG: DUF350 domain-containing protein, partial [Opitutaceae bacterium]